LTNRSFAKETSASAEPNPTSSEREPKKDAERKSKRAPVEEILDAPAGKVSDHLRQRPTARVRRGGPKDVYKRAANRSKGAESGTPRISSLSNLESHRAIAP